MTTRDPGDAGLVRRHLRLISGSGSDEAAHHPVTESDEIEGLVPTPRVYSRVTGPSWEANPPGRASNPLAAYADELARGTPPFATPRPRRPIIALRQISVGFGGVHALDQVDLDVAEHEVVAVVGENAAGKSTLAKVIAGVVQPSSGVIEVDGAPVTITDPGMARRLGIAMVFQELALADNLDVTANLFLGQERLHHGLLNVLEMEETARRHLNKIGARITSVRTPVGQLSGGQRQSIAIARAMLGEPRVILLDEPTSSLSITQTAEVLNLIQRLRDLGRAVVLISHNLGDVRAVADRVVVLRHGQNNGSAAMSDVSYEDIVAAVTGAVSTLPVPRQTATPRVSFTPSQAAEG
ncbi:MAG: ATP-binding cassette domain-containing protein [Propionibacteriaceae bacterium]|jgi:D-xylose transport system ATP-binding protein|nr:ATP-binding cassette domain-containing protein [Propionibacteriaceae bacterium]